MTVGELVAQIASQNSSPISKDMASSIEKVREIYEKNFGPEAPFRKALEKNMEMVNSAVESVRPQLETMERLRSSIPSITLPRMIEEDDYLLPEMINPIREVRVTNIHELNGYKSNRQSDVVVAEYLLPKNATWESLDIKFLDGHIIQVSYPGMKSMKFDYKDMGFLNVKRNIPNLKWELLKVMANNGGSLIKNNWDKRFGRNVKYELNEALKKFFGMKTNPIPHYTRKHGYNALFSLRGERY
jgi:hypothetical protein